VLCEHLPPYLPRRRRHHAPRHTHTLAHAHTHTREKNASGAGGGGAAAAAEVEEEEEEEALGGAAAHLQQPGCCSVRACVRADCEAAAVRLAQVLRLLVLVP
jgi:hypothetical protein